MMNMAKKKKKEQKQKKKARWRDTFWGGKKVSERSKEKKREKRD